MRFLRPPIAAALICLFIALTNANAQRPTETSLKDAVAAAEKALGTDSLQVATALANLGAFYTAAGNIESAGPPLQRAERIVARHPEMPALEMARILEAVGVFYVRVRSPQQAEKLLSRALEIYQRDAHMLPVATAESLKQTIISAAGDSDESIRMTAVRYLGQIGSTEDLPLLQRIADSNKAPVKDYALRAMDSIRKR